MEPVEKYHRFALVALLFLFIYMVSYQLNHSAAYTNQPHNADIERRVDYWLQSAACAQQTGILLAMCSPEGNVVGIENVSLADDRGQAFVFGWLARHSAILPDKNTLTRFNLLLNALGLITLVAVIWTLTYERMALFVFGLGLIKLLPGPIPGPDVPSGYLGLTIFAFIPSLLWAGYWARKIQSARWVVLGSVVSVGIATLFRQPIAVMGLLQFAATASILPFALERRTRKEALIGLGLGAALIVITMKGSATLLQARHLIWNVPVSQQQSSHGLSQSLFHGLGATENPWGIEWSDVYGLTLMRRLHPDVPYLSKDYMNILGDAYWEIIKSEPFNVLHVYATKAKQVLHLPIRWLGFPFFLVAFVIAMAVITCLIRFPATERFPLVFGLAWGFGALAFVLQAVMIIPWMLHIYPVKWCSMVMAIALLEAVLRWREGRGPSIIRASNGLHPTHRRRTKRDARGDRRPELQRPRQRSTRITKRTSDPRRAFGRGSRPPSA